MIGKKPNRLQHFKLKKKFEMSNDTISKLKSKQFSCISVDKTAFVAVLRRLYL